MRYLEAMMKMTNKENGEFDERQMFDRYRYGLHCYAISLILVFINAVAKTFFAVNFENEFDFLLLVLGISAAYYIFRLIMSDAFFPKSWRKKASGALFFMLIVNMLLIVRWTGVTHDINEILNEKLIYSDFIENFVMQFFGFVMLLSFSIRRLQEKREEKAGIF